MSKEETTKNLGSINKPTEEKMEEKHEMTAEEAQALKAEKEKERLKNLETAKNLKTPTSTWKNFNKLRKMIEPEYIEVHRTDELIDVYSEYAKRYKEYFDSVDVDIKNVEKIEQDLIKIAQEFEGNLRKKNYVLPTGMHVKNLDNKHYTYRDIAKMINALLNKIEVGYSETLGLFQLYQWWSMPKTEIPFDILNSTLRILGSSVKFKGFEQWKSILVINEYFNGSHEEFTKDTAAVQFVAAIHEVLMDKMDLEKPLNKETPAVEGPAMIVENEEQLKQQEEELKEK